MSSWDLWIVTMIQKWQTRRQTKAVIKSVDYTRDISLKVIRSLLNRSPWKIIFAPPGFWRQIKPLKTFSIEEKGRYIVLKGVTYSISREDKQQKKTQAWMKEKKINQCLDLNRKNIPVTSHVLLKKKQFKSTQRRCKDMCSPAVPPGKQSQRAGSPTSQEHHQAEKAEITELQRANFCLCALLITH